MPTCGLTGELSSYKLGGGGGGVGGEDALWLLIWRYVILRRNANRGLPSAFKKRQLKC
jgi:hypothetical protein